RQAALDIAGASTARARRGTGSPAQLPAEASARLEAAGPAARLPHRPGRPSVAGRVRGRALTGVPPESPAQPDVNELGDLLHAFTRRLRRGENPDPDVEAGGIH